MKAFYHHPLFTKPAANLAILALLLVVLFGYGLGGRPYSVPSESRYIEIGREMAESGDFITPRLNYVKYFEKPALFYWVQAEMTKYFGLDPFVVRVPTMLFVVALCMLTWGLGELLYGRLTAWLASLTLATSLYVFALSRIVLVDAPVSVFIVAALYAFFYAVRKPEGCSRTVALYAMYAAAACAVLCKGLIGAVLPGAVVFIWLACTKQWKILSSIRLVSGTALFLLIAVPWHVLVSLRNPEFLHFYFIHEHVERYLTTVHGRYQPDWFFIVVLVAGFFPWTVFLAQSLYSGFKGFWNSRFEEGSRLFLFIWVMFIFVFFSLSDSKLIPYILPIFPPLAVFLGHYFADVWQEKPVAFFKTGLFFIIILLLAMAVAPIAMPHMFDEDSKVMEAVNQAKGEIQVLSVVSIIAAGILLVTFIQGHRRHLIMVMIVVAAAVIQVGDMVAVHYNKDSMAEIAKTIQVLDKPGDEVISFEEYFQDLPIYLKRKITVVNWTGTELSFGAEHENTLAWMIDDKEFWRRWNKNDHRIFAVMHTDVLRAIVGKQNPEKLHLFILTQVGRNLLIINQNPELPH